MNRMYKGKLLDFQHPSLLKTKSSDLPRGPVGYVRQVLADGQIIVQLGRVSWLRRQWWKLCAMPLLLAWVLVGVAVAFGVTLAVLVIWSGGRQP